MKTTNDLRPEGAREMHVTQFGDHAQSLRRYATIDGYLFVDEATSERAAEMEDEALDIHIETWDAEMDGEWADPDDGCDGSEDAWDYPAWRAITAVAAAYAVERASRDIAASR